MGKAAGPELYSLRDDPGEEANVIKKRPDVADRLRSDLEGFLAGVS